MLKIIGYLIILNELKLIINNQIEDVPLVAGFLKYVHHQMDNLENNSVDCDNKTNYNEKNELKVGIIGGGIAGLYAALILKDIGLNYEVLEASDRFGGRILTHYFDLTQKYDYVDAGAMRFPNNSNFGRLFGFHEYSLINYLNKRVEQRNQVVLKPFNFVDTFYYFNEIKLHNNDSLGCDKLHFGIKNGGNVPDVYAKKGYLYWIKSAFDPFRARLLENYEKGFKYLLSYDNISVRKFLSSFTDSKLGDLAPYPDEVIDWLDFMDFGTGKYHSSLTEYILPNFNYALPNSPQTDWFLIDNGSSELVNAIVSLLDPVKLIKNQKVLEIYPQNLNSITINTDFGSRTYNHLISSVSLGVLRTMDLSKCKLSVAKNNAIRVLHYVNAIKIVLKFRTRWWQNSDVMKGRPIYGGSTKTDLPIRTIFYPSYGLDEDNAPGILIVSYVVGDDAVIGGLKDEDLERLCLRDLKKIHGDIVDDEYSGEYFVKIWDYDEHTLGGFAQFYPSEYTSHYKNLIRPEVDGRLHFAGEAASFRHGWVTGALDSAYRSVREILDRECLKEKLDLLDERWGLDNFY